MLRARNLAGQAVVTSRLLGDARRAVRAGALDAAFACVVAARRPSARWRPLPDFVVIGAQKAGTSTLYARLQAHPLVLGALRKEVHYFDVHWGSGLSWYRAHFPTTARRRWVERRESGRSVTGEASPYYLFHPAVPERLHRVLPHVKLVAILRDPVDRAVSEYHHAVRWGFEPRPIEVALDAEHEVQPPVSGEAEWHDRSDGPARQRSYVARGRYAEQLERWLRVWPRDQLLVVETGQLRADTALPAVLAHLGLPEVATPTVADRNVHVYPRPDPGLTRQLAAYYAPYNKALFDLLGQTWDWSR